MVSPREFFMGFSKYHNSLRITYEESIATATNRIISYADELGRMLGYRIFSELTCSSLFKMAGEQCPVGLERRKPDMCWGYLTGKEKGNYEFELVFESEQSMDEKRIEEDLNELLLFPAKLKVLYCSHNKPIQVVQILKKVAENKKQRICGEFLLIIDPWVSKKTFSTGKLGGYLLDSSLQVKNFGGADVISLEDGVHHIRLFNKVVWQDSVDDNLWIQ